MREELHGESEYSGGMAESSGWGMYMVHRPGVRDAIRVIRMEIGWEVPEGPSQGDIRNGWLWWHTSDAQSAEGARFTTLRVRARTWHARCGTFFC